MFSAKEKLLLFCLSFIQFSHIVDYMILMPLGPQLMRVFNITPHQFGLLVSAYTIAAGVAGLGAMFFIDKFDRKRVLLFFYMGFCVGTLACAFSPNYHVLLITRTLTGCFGGVLGSLILTIVGDSIEPQRRASAMGIVMLSFSLASIAGVPFGLFLANRFNWHAPFFFLGGLSFLLTGLIMKAFPSMKAHLNENNRLSTLDFIRSVFKTPTYLFSLIFVVFLVIGQFSVIPFLSPAMVSNAGLLETQLPLIYLVGGLAAIFSSPLVGRWADYWGKRRVFYVMLVGSFVPIITATHIRVIPLAWILTIMGFFFVFTSARMITGMSMVTGVVEPQYRGSFMSMVTSTQQFAAGIGSYIAGLIVQKGADGHLLHFNRVGYLAVAFSVAAAWAASRIQSSATR